MTNEKNHAPIKTLVQEYTLDAPREKVWRAITIPAFRENWLPQETLRDAAPSAVIPGQEVTYKMQDTEPPFFESTVTFRLSDTEKGETSLLIIHKLTDPKVRGITKAANTNTPPLMRAA